MSTQINSSFVLKISSVFYLSLTRESVKGCLLIANFWVGQITLSWAKCWSWATGWVGL